MSCPDPNEEAHLVLRSHWAGGGGFLRRHETASPAHKNASASGMLAPTPGNYLPKY